MKNVLYAYAVGSLMYNMVCTRPYITHVVGVVSRFLSNPSKDHCKTVKWILKYLRGTSRVFVGFGSGDPMLDGYTYENMANDIDSTKSTSGYMMTSAEGAICQQSRLQKCDALSTTKPKYISTN